MASRAARRPPGACESAFKITAPQIPHMIDSFLPKESAAPQPPKLRTLEQSLAPKSSRPPIRQNRRNASHPCQSSTQAYLLPDYSLLLADRKSQRNFHRPAPNVSALPALHNNTGT